MFLRTGVLFLAKKEKNKTFRVLKLWGTVSDIQNLFYIMASKKRNARQTEIDKETKDADTKDKGEISQCIDIMLGIASIQNILANFLLRFLKTAKVNI